MRKSFRNVLMIDQLRIDKRTDLDQMIDLQGKCIYYNKDHYSKSLVNEASKGSRGK